jgi:hypothetical protein
MAETHQPTLVGLAATITETAQAITRHLEANSLPIPSFAENGPAAYPPAPEILGPRFQLLEALTDMFHLAMGPSDLTFMQPLLVSFSL